MAPDPVPYVGERLREERLRRGVSVRSLARDLGVSASLISQIETGKSQPSVGTLYAITTALDISIEDVFEPPHGPEGRPPIRPHRRPCSRRSEPNAVSESARWSRPVPARSSSWTRESPGSGWASSLGRMSTSC